VEKLQADVNDALELHEMAEDDPAMQSELLAGAEEMATRLEALETRALMKEPVDIKPFLSLYPCRRRRHRVVRLGLDAPAHVYRWCERQGFQVEEVDMIGGEEAGIRSVTLLVKGDYAYGMLKAESGIHRWCAFHPSTPTSAATPRFARYASPQVDDSIDIDVKEEDLKIDTYRSSGPAASTSTRPPRPCHYPPALQDRRRCQNERSQHQNKAVAIEDAAFASLPARN